MGSGDLPSLKKRFIVKGTLSVQTLHLKMFVKNKLV